MSMERSRIRVLNDSDDSSVLNSAPPKALKEIINRPVEIELEDWILMPEEEQELRATEYRAARKVKLAQVLDRGVVAVRLQVNLPPELHGEWVSNDIEDVYRMKSLGYIIDDTYAPGRALHSEGDRSKSIVGDVLFMTCSREDHEIQQEIMADKFDQIHGTQPTQSEEQKFKNQVAARTPEIPVVEESRARTVRREEIAAAVGTAPVEVND